MYIETSRSSSKPLKDGDVARLDSPILPAGDDFCLSFYYHMFGPDVNKLQVRQLMNRYSRVLWIRRGSQGRNNCLLQNIDFSNFNASLCFLCISGNVWKKATLNINSQADYQMSFEAYAGPSFAGDIAIDDVTVQPGLCPISNNCDFEGKSRILTHDDKA